MYSRILACSLGRLSDSERNSITKSEQRGTKPFRCWGVRDSHRSLLTQDASGERLAPLGRLKPVEESKPSPKSSCSSHQWASWPVILKFRFPDSPPVGGFTINSPVAVRSSLRSRLAAESPSNCAGVTCKAIAVGITRDRVSDWVGVCSIVISLKLFH